MKRLMLVIALAVISTTAFGQTTTTGSAYKIGNYWYWNTWTPYSPPPGYQPYPTGYQHVPRVFIPNNEAFDRGLIELQESIRFSEERKLMMLQQEKLRLQINQARQETYAPPAGPMAYVPASPEVKASWSSGSNWHYALPKVRTFDELTLPVSKVYLDENGEPIGSTQAPVLRLNSK